MEEKNEQFNKEILSQIKERKVEMKPHWIFILRTILGVLGAILVSLCLVFLVSFIFFGLRKSGVMLAPGFGPQGFFLFMMSLPWVLILISAAFLIVLQILINKYAFIYKKPIIYSVLGIVALTTLISFILPSFAFHNSIFKAYKPERGMEMPPVGRFYRSFGVPHPPDLVRGVVLEFSTGTLIVVTDDGVTSSVMLSNFTKISPGTILGSGEELLIFGPRSTSGVIRAFGIREIRD